MRGARCEVADAGLHNVWLEGDRIYIGYHRGLRVVDVSGELRGTVTVWAVKQCILGPRTNSL